MYLLYDRQNFLCSLKEGIIFCMNLCCLPHQHGVWQIDISQYMLGEMTRYTTPLHDLTSFPNSKICILRSSSNWNEYINEYKQILVLTSNTVSMLATNYLVLLSLLNSLPVLSSANLVPIPLHFRNISFLIYFLLKKITKITNYYNAVYMRS